MHELCYATADDPRGPFTYGGVIVSNCDIGVTKDKPAELPVAYGGNNHGSIVEIGGKWYIFYHRQTNGTWYSRQGCAEEIRILPDGRIPQVEITSCGLNGGPLPGKGTYGAYLACNLFTDRPMPYVGGDAFPKVMQDGRDGDEEPGYIGNIKENATAGFKYFDFKGVKSITITVRGYANGAFEVRTQREGAVLATIPVEYTNVWEDYTSEIAIPDGVGALYLTYKGGGNASLLQFTLA